MEVLEVPRRRRNRKEGRNKNNDNINNNGIPTDHSASDVSSAIIIDDDYDDDDDDDGIVISRDAVHEKRHGVDNSMDEINSDIADSDSESDDGLLKNPFSALL